jgi:hypothetical protein
MDTMELFFFDDWRIQVLSAACKKSTLISSRIAAWAVAHREEAAWCGGHGSSIPSLIAGIGRDLQIGRSRRLAATFADAASEWMECCQ